MYFYLFQNCRMTFLLNYQKSSPFKYHTIKNNLAEDFTLKNIRRFDFVDISQTQMWHPAFFPQESQSLSIVGCVQLLSRVQLFCGPMDCSPSGYSVHEISWATILECVAISFSRSSSPPRDQTHVSYISCIGRQIPYHCPTWEVILLIDTSV